MTVLRKFRYPFPRQASAEFYQTLETIIIDHAEKLTPCDLEEIITKHRWVQNANTKTLMLSLSELIVREHENFSLHELSRILLAYVEEDVLDEQLLQCIAQRGYEDMVKSEALDLLLCEVSFYYCLTKAGFKGDSFTKTNQSGKVVKDNIYKVLLRRIS